MSFGKNPHVAKATLAEQKAKAAGDENTRASAWRDAARQWERAAERETIDKRIAEYTANAEAARREADAEGSSTDDDASPPAAAAAPRPLDRSSLN